MIAAFLRFVLLGAIVGVIGGVAVMLILRWGFPVFKRGQIEENKAHDKLCRELKVSRKMKEGKKE